MAPTDIVQEWNRRAARAREDAHRILAGHERSVSSRVIILEDLMKRLAPLPIDVESYFKEAVKCLEVRLTRAAIVLSWSGFFQLFAERLYADYEQDIRANRNWSFKDLSDLKEQRTEHAIIEVAKVVGMINNAKRRDYQGDLSKRNRCAHPTMYQPSLNTAIGFVDEMIREASDYI
jgi:hypothetical protein